MTGMFFLLAGILHGVPPVAVACLMAGSLFLILLDVCGGLPFLLAVKPSERTEMSAIYSSFRDVSGILTPGGAWLVLLVWPVSGLFVAGSLPFFFAWLMGRRLHPRLGHARVSVEKAPAADAGADAPFMSGTSLQRE
jgi:hypothetical protein